MKTYKSYFLQLKSGKGKDSLTTTKGDSLSEIPDVALFPSSGFLDSDNHLLESRSQPKRTT